MRFLRQWAGLVDVTHDSTPILGKTPVDGLYVNGGWGTGGFKAIPAGGWCLAHLMATGRSHHLATGFGLERFQTGALIAEASAAGIAHAGPDIMLINCPYCGPRAETSTE